LPCEDSVREDVVRCRCIRVYQSCASAVSSQIVWSAVGITDQQIALGTKSLVSAGGVPGSAEPPLRSALFTSTSQHPATRRVTPLFEESSLGLQASYPPEEAIMRMLRRLPDQPCGLGKSADFHSLYLQEGRRLSDAGVETEVPVPLRDLYGKLRECWSEITKARIEQVSALPSQHQSPDSTCMKPSRGSHVSGTP